MSARRSTGPRVSAGTGPRTGTAQPASPTTVQLGGDRVLIGAREVDISQLRPDPEQPRKHMDPARLDDLANSIAAHGVLQALLVREDGMGRDGDMRYVIIAGERRYAAIKTLIARMPDEETRQRLGRVPIVIRDTEAAERRVLQLIENLQREELPPVEEAHALKELMRLENLTTTGVAARIHRSQGYVDERLRLVRHEDVEAAVEAGVLTRSAAAAVASIEGTDERRAWIERAQAGQVVRPREVYGSKPNRRGTPQTATPPAETSSQMTEPTALRGSSPLPETGHDQHSGLPNFGNPANAEGSLPTPGVPSNGARRVPLATVERDIISELVTGASADERTFADHLLAAGTAAGWSCAELLERVRGQA